MKILVTKTEIAKKHFLEGDLKSCLRYFKTFKLGISREDKRAIEIAFECLAGKTCFYQSLGIDTSSMVEKAVVIISKYFKIK